jgi:hypothetical protein
MQTCSQSTPQSVPRNIRGALAWSCLILAALVVPVPKANAATTYNITTTSMASAVDGVCTLTEALASAQADATVNECVSTAGPYTINLTNGTYSFTTKTYVDGNFGDTAYGFNAADVSIFGNGATLNRAGGADTMRLFYVGSSRSLTLRNVTVSGFTAATGAQPAACFAGAIGAVQGTINIEDSTLTGNSVPNLSCDGPALGVFLSTVNIHRSTISNNTSPDISTAQLRINQNSTLNMANSTIHGARIGLSTSFNSVSHLSNVTVSGQSALIFDASGTVNAHNSLLFSDCSMNGGTVNLFNTAAPLNCGGSQPAYNLGTLGNNGGATQTRGIFFGQFPQDKAPACTYASAGSNPLFANGAAITTDQRGFARDASCDLGAVELFTISALTPFAAQVDAAYSGTITASGAGAPVTFVATGSLPPGLTLSSSGTLSGTPTAAGSFTFDVEATDSGGFKSVRRYTSFPVSRANQTLAFNTQMTASRSFVASGTFPINPLATASSGLTPIYSSGSTSVCTVLGTTVTMVSAGTCILRANQSGNTNYNAAPQVTQNVTINAGVQTLIFNAQTTASQTFVASGSFAINPAATTNAGAPGVEHSSLTPTVCTVSGTSVTMVSTGTCTLRASHVGNSNYQPAVSGTQDVTINPGMQLIAFTAPTPKALGELPFTVSATGGPSGNPVTFTSLTPAVCTATGVNGSLVSLLLAGTCTLRAAQAGNANYIAATSVDRSFLVGSGTSTVAVESSQNPAPFRAAVTLTARIGGVAPGGSVRFLNGAATLCDAVVVNGIATCTTADLMEGAHSIRVYYQGDTNNLGAFSAELIQVVPKIGVRQGAWWGGPQGNGWGLSIMEQGDTLVVGWYYFDATGKPVWLIVPGCAWNANKTICSGSLQRATSSWFGNYRAADVRLAQVGTATLSFNEDGSARFDYTVDGTSGSKSITRLGLGGNPLAPFDLTNVWWGGQNQNGWGLSLFVAGQTLAGVWYTYDTQGQPTWMLFNGGGWQNPTRYRTQLFRATGAPMIGAAYDASRLNAQPVGELYFEFTDINTAEMTYLVDGLLQFKPISKQKF